MTSIKWCLWRGTMHSDLGHSDHGGEERPTVNVRHWGELTRPVLKHGPRSPCTCASTC